MLRKFSYTPGSPYLLFPSEVWDMILAEFKRLNELPAFALVCTRFSSKVRHTLYPIKHLKTYRPDLFAELKQKKLYITERVIDLSWDEINKNRSLVYWDRLFTNIDLNIELPVVKIIICISIATFIIFLNSIVTESSSIEKHRTPLNNLIDWYLAISMSSIVVVALALILFESIKLAVMSHLTSTRNKHDINYAAAKESKNRFFTSLALGRCHAEVHDRKIDSQKNRANREPSLN